jgi:hypothetical protein
MPHFSRHGAYYSASLITGPRSVLLRLRFTDVDIAVPAVTLLAADTRYGNATEREVAQTIQRAVDEANDTFGSSFVVAEVQYQSDNDVRCSLMGRAAFRIVKQLVEAGEGGFAAPPGDAC